MPINPADYLDFDGTEDNMDDQFYDEFVEDTYDDLDEDFEDCIGFEPIQKSRDPEGSLTDHLRSVESNRNGANKRHREARRKLKEFNITTQWGKDDE